MRSKNALLNIISGWLGQFCLIIVNLLSRKFFLNYLGEVYLGLNGLLTNIITFLSMADLGIGTAITFSLYKPIANNDIDSLKSIMKFFKRVYWIVGIMIIAIGLILTPFLPMFIGEEGTIDGLSKVFFFFLFNTAITYFFSYKSTLIIANQKGYLFNINHYIWQFVMYSLQIVVLICSKNYYYYLFVQLLTTVLENIIISHIAKRLYPFLREKDILPIAKEVKADIYKNSLSMILNKIGSTIVNSTDNVLISIFVNVTSVGRFNNYSTIVTAARDFLQKGITATISSVGNFSVNETNERKKEIFDLYYLISTWLFGWLVIGMYFLLPPFVEIFYGKQYILDSSIILCMCINSFMDGQVILFGVFISAMGLYWHLRYVGIIEAFINLVISICLGKEIGMLGIILGTFLSKICFSFWLQSKVVLNIGLHVGRMQYIKQLLKDSFVFLAIALVIYGISRVLSTEVVSYFVELLCFCLVIPNVVMYIVYRKSGSFQKIKNIFVKFIKERLKR